MTESELKEKAREARNAYNREWYAHNKEKCRERNRRYWQKKAMQTLAGASAKEQED